MAHDQLILSFFIHTFHIGDPSDDLHLQTSLSTANAGMGILFIQHMAPAAYLASPWSHDAFLALPQLETQHKQTAAVIFQISILASALSL